MPVGGVGGGGRGGPIITMALPPLLRMGAVDDRPGVVVVVVAVAAPVPVTAVAAVPAGLRVGDGDAVGLMELFEEWLSECREPVDWYNPAAAMERRLQADDPSTSSHVYRVQKKNPVLT